MIWPTITPEQLSKAGLAWSIFPNLTILQGITFALCYRARPHGEIPTSASSSRTRSSAIRTGGEPKTEWVYAEPTKEKWGLVLSQDFSNMDAVQKGMRSRGFRGPLPNPHQERKVTNFHRNLVKYMGMGGMRRIE